MHHRIKESQQEPAVVGKNIRVVKCQNGDFAFAERVAQGRPHRASFATRTEWHCLADFVEHRLDGRGVIPEKDTTFLKWSDNFLRLPEFLLRTLVQAHID